MADNLAVTPGSGATIATDEVTWGGSTVHLPLGKLALGADGTVEVLSRGQQTMTNSLPVAIASNQSALAVTDNSGSLTVDNAGTFAVQVDGAALTSLQLIDDAVYTDGTGTVTKGLAILGQDGTNPQAIKTDASGELQVDVLTLPNVTIGTMAALVAGTANIGDVDVLTVNGVAPAFGSGVRGSTVQRVTIATDDVVPASQSGTWNVGISSGSNTIGGVTLVNTGATPKSAGGTVASSGNNTLIAAVTSKKIKVVAFSLTTTASTSTTCIFQSGAGGTELWRVILLPPTGGMAGANLATALPSWLFETAVTTLLNLNLSAANTIHWSVSYIEEA